MQYLILLYEDESLFASLSPDEMGQVLERYGAFTRSIQETGEFISGEALAPVETATSVRVREGRTMLTDGPFAETREQLGGYYLVECKDLDRATEIASQIPAAETGTVEVRPIHTYS